jgi:hypothetical protein
MFLTSDSEGVPKFHWQLQMLLCSIRSHHMQGNWWGLQTESSSSICERIGDENAHTSFPTNELN